MSLLIADFSYPTKAELNRAEFLTRCQEIAAELDIPFAQNFVSLIYPQPGLPELVAKPGLPASILAYPPHKEPFLLSTLASDWSQLPTNPLTYSVGPGSNFNRVGETLLELAGLAYDEERGWRDRGSVVVVPPEDSCLATFLGHAISHYLQSGLLSAPLYMCWLAPVPAPANASVEKPEQTAATEPACSASFPIYRGSTANRGTAELARIDHLAEVTNEWVETPQCEFQLYEWD